ncbi:hypothetical protein [Jeotgalibacillus malaysiensis]|uniref:hypothetical protein n=1 Tax=Jeotgalibacillus malaysiensis TaxID=1508404 RepID=UPI003850B4A0
MTKELDNIMSWYSILVDSQMITKRMLRDYPEYIPQQSEFVARSIPEASELLDKSMNELNDLTIVSLISVFEQHMHNYIADLIHKQIETHKISAYLIRRAERDRFEEIIDAFKSETEPHIAGMVKQVYRYRNWVAHGKQNQPPPATIDPASAYERLSDFLQHLH